MQAPLTAMGRPRDVCGRLPSDAGRACLWLGLGRGRGLSFVYAVAAQKGSRVCVLRGNAIRYNHLHGRIAEFTDAGRAACARAACWARRAANIATGRRDVRTRTGRLGGARWKEVGVN